MRKRKKSSKKKVEFAESNAFTMPYTHYDRFRDCIKKASNIPLIIVVIYSIFTSINGTVADVTRLNSLKLAISNHLIESKKKKFHI